jgi:WD40 repeat protein
MMAEELQPYVGPRPFEESNRHLFFGRDGEANELMSLVVAHPAVLVYAQSGAGKTSILNAKLIPLLKEQGYEVLPLARIQGLENENASNIFVFNTILSWAEGENDESSEFLQMTLSEFLKKRPHVQKVPDLAPKSPADEADDADENTAPDTWEFPRFVIFDQFEELFTSYQSQWEKKREFFEQVRDALDDDYLLRVVFVMREDYIAELDPYVSLLPERLSVRVRLERLKKAAALDAVVKPLEFTTRTFAQGVANTLVTDLMTSSNDETAVELYVETLQLQVVCQNLWQSLRPNDQTITLKHLEKCGDVKQALMSFYEKSIRSIVGERGVADGGHRITEGDLRRWFEHVLITPERKRAVLYRGSERTAGMSNDSIVNPLAELQLLKLEWRAGSRWCELSHDRFIEPILTSNNEWLMQQSLTEQIRMRLETRAADFAQGFGGLLSEDELLEARRLEAPRHGGSPPPSDLLLNFLRASRAPAQQRKMKLLSLGVAALLVVSLLVTGLSYFAVRQAKAAEQAKGEAQNEKTNAEAALESAKKAWGLANEQKTIAEDQLGKAKSAKAEADKQRIEAEQAKTKATNAERQARTDSEAAKKSDAQSTERMLVAEGEILIKDNKDLTQGGLLVITAAELDNRLGKGEVVSTSELQKLRLRAAEAEKPSLVQELPGEDSLRHHAREIVRSMLPELSRQPKVLKAETAATSATISPDGNYIVVTTGRRQEDNRSQLDAAEAGALVWKVEGSGAHQQETESENDKSRPKYELKGHTSQITSVAFSRDSKYILTTSADMTARVWNSEDGKELAVLRGHAGSVGSGAFIPNDSSLVLTTSEDKSIRLWKWQSPTDRLNPKVLSGHTGGVHALAIDASGKYFATEAADGTARLWNLDDVKNAGSPASIRLEGLLGPVPALAFSPDGERLVTEGMDVCGDYVAIVWNVNKLWNSFGHSGAESRSVNPNPRSEDCQSATNAAPVEFAFFLRGHRGAITSVSFSSNGKYIVTASADETARIWNATSGVVIAELRGHTAPVSTAYFDPDDKYVISSALDKTARSWDFAGNSLAVLRGHTSDLVGAKFSSNGQFIVTASTDGTTRVWGAPNELCGSERGMTELRGHTDGVYSVVFSPDGNLVLTGSFDGTARLWDPQTGQAQKMPFGLANRATFNREGESIVTSGSDVARIWRRNDKGKWQQVPPEDKDDNLPRGANFSAAFSPDNRYVVTSGRKGDSGVVQVWKRQGDGKWKSEAVLPHPGFVLTATFDPLNDHRLLTGCFDGKARIWQQDVTGKWDAISLDGHQGPILGASFSRDGRFIVTASSDRTARVWRKTEMGTWEDPPFTLVGHRHSVYGAVFSPDGEYIVTASADKTAGVWKRQGDNQWKLVSVLSNQDDFVLSASFSPDGRFIATASQDGKARIYSKVMFEPFEEVLKDAVKLKPYLFRVSR